MNNLHILNLAAYNRPEISENKNKDWVNYGQNNNYYQYIIDRYNGSATNNAIINGVVNMIYGKGLDATNSSKKPDEYAQMKSIFSNDCIRKTVLDLKLLGEGSMQILYKNGKVYKAEHFPRQTLRAEKCNEEGQIEAYYYHHNWEKIKPSEQPKRIPTFGYGNGKESEIKIIKRYVSGYDYYAPVDYQGGLAYAELEEEIADYLINEVQCGFSGTKVVNFNNGVPDREKQMQVKDDVLGKLTGSRGEKVIVAFNNNSESKTTVDDIPLNDAPQHYEYLSNECVKKLIISHRVTSPLLIGVKDGNSGLGNNADEIKTATLLFDNIVIKPYQELLTDCFDAILGVNGISLNLYFRTLQPLEFTETDDIVTEEQREEETGVKMSKEIDGRTAYETKEEAVAVAKEMGCKGYHEHKLDGVTYYMPCETHDLEKHCCELSKEDLTDEEFDIILDELRGETISNRWEEVDSREYSEDNDDIEAWASNLIESKQENLEKTSIDSKKSGFSYLDKSLYKVRYKYDAKYSSGKSRQFCRIMMSRSGRGVVYRIEDIDKASNAGVNKSFGHKGKPYDLFRFKGGVNCGHVWKEVLYRLKSKTMKKDIRNYKEVDDIPKTYKPTPRGYKDARKAPKDMPNNGHHPNYRK
jgi:hypothetical protein